MKIVPPNSLVFEGIPPYAMSSGWHLSGEASASRYCRRLNLVGLIMLEVQAVAAEAGELIQKAVMAM